MIGLILTIAVLGFLCGWGFRGRPAGPVHAPPELNSDRARLFHYVKNDLQVVVSLLNLEAEDQLSWRTRQSLTDSQARIHCIGLVYEQLSKGSDRGISVSVRDYLESLLSSFVPWEGDFLPVFHLNVTPAGLRLSPKYVSRLGLILYEILASVMGTHDKGKGSYSIELSENREALRFLFRQEGDGPLWAPPTGTVRDSIIDALAKQVNGKILSSTGQGNLFEMHSPIPQSPLRTSTGRKEI